MNQIALFAPPEYWKLSEDERKNYRCGPGRGILEWLVPDNILGVDVQPACGVHDFMYSEGRTDQDKIDADMVFRNNMVRLIEAHHEIHGAEDKLLTERLAIAQGYYESVSHFGGPAFWKGKNKPEEMGMVSLLPYRKSDGFV